jgi:hypothetical protein
MSPQRVATGFATAATVAAMSPAHPVSRFGHVELEDMPEDLRSRVGAVAERSGFVPNVFV